MSIKYRRDIWKILTIPGDAAEIGVAEGNFAEDMLRMPVNFPTVYLVDRWECIRGQRGDGGHEQAWHNKNLEQVVKRMVPYATRVRILHGDSVAMAQYVPDESLVLANIDCDHSYEGCLRDLKAWTPKVKPGGVVMLHDYENPSYGVKQAVQEFCRGMFIVELLPEDKPDDAGCYFLV